MDQIFVKPGPDLKVRKPVNGYLAPDGEWVNRETYWLRRLADGDVIEADPLQNKAAAVVKTAKTV